MDRYMWIRLCIFSLFVRVLHSVCWNLDPGNFTSTSGLLEPENEWRLWKQAHRKSYGTSTEELERYIIWRSNIAYIGYHNNYWHKFGFRLRMNQFGDMTSAEFVQSVKCVETLKHIPPIPVTYFDAVNYSRAHLPDQIDWRTKGAVTPVKNQGRCHSCYAFSVAGALEGMHALSSGKLVSLSEQNIIDCSVPYGNRGCSGGSRETSIIYVVDNGLDKGSSYPYTGRQYLCKFNSDNVGATCSGMIRIRRGNELNLKAAVAIAGPVTVAVDSRHPTFQFYAEGIYNEPSCSRTKLTHSLLIIGYGTKKGKDYWLLKNSWGTTWGMNGYVMMSRNMANQCGIATRALYPTA